MLTEYMHGYSDEEAARLVDQALVLRPHLEDRMIFPAGSKVLEAGCGVGAETVTLASVNPDCEFTCVDISPSSIARAKALIEAKGLTNVRFVEADINNLPFVDNQFDHCFFCFVLEHLRDPASVLQKVSRVVKPEGTIRAIESDNGTNTFTPSSSEIDAVIRGADALQKFLGGNSCMGRTLTAVMNSAGLRGVSGSEIRIDTADPERGDAARIVLERIIAPVYASLRNQVLAGGFAEAAKWDEGIRQFEAAAAAQSGGTRNFSCVVYAGEAAPYLGE